jgi:hypothetical protein
LSVPLLTGRFFLPVLRIGNRFALANLAASLLLGPTFPLTNTKRHEFVRTAIHWKMFSSGFEMRKPDLLGLFSDKPFLTRFALANLATPYWVWPI